MHVSSYEHAWDWSSRWYELPIVGSEERNQVRGKSSSTFNQWAISPTPKRTHIAATNALNSRYQVVYNETLSHTEANTTLMQILWRCKAHVYVHRLRTEYLGFTFMPNTTEHKLHNLYKPQFPHL